MGSLMNLLLAHGGRAALNIWHQCSWRKSPRRVSTPRSSRQTPHGIPKLQLAPDFFGLDRLATLAIGCDLIFAFALPVKDLDERTPCLH